MQTEKWQRIGKCEGECGQRDYNQPLFEGKYGDWLCEKCLDWEMIRDKTEEFQDIVEKGHEIERDLLGSQ